jgi:hypothetical protein
MPEQRETTETKEIKAKSDIDATNFKQAAQDAIHRYFENGHLLDALAWSRIIGCYDEALRKSEE